MAGDGPITATDAEDMQRKMVKEGVPADILCDCIDNLASREVPIKV